MPRECWHTKSSTCSANGIHPSVPRGWFNGNRWAPWRMDMFFCSKKTPGKLHQQQRSPINLALLKIEMKKTPQAISPFQPSPDIRKIITDPDPNEATYRQIINWAPLAARYKSVATFGCTCIARITRQLQFSVEHRSHHKKIQWLPTKTVDIYMWYLLKYVNMQLSCVCVFLWF